MNAPSAPDPSDESGELLTGGNVGQVWRVGETVRRETGPWSPVVHRLLAHLEGMPGVPKCHGIDQRGREVLDFLPAQIVDVDCEMLTDAPLIATAKWTRQLHRATHNFADSGPWRFPALPGANLIGHNDIAPYNVCFDNDALTGVFDWDLAGPTTSLLELGSIAWTCVPLFRLPDVADPDGFAAARLTLVANAYGGVDPSDVLAATLKRTEYSISGMRAAAAAGDIGMQRLMAATGEPGPTRRNLVELRRRVSAIADRLRRTAAPLRGAPISGSSR